MRYANSAKLRRIWIENKLNWKRKGKNLKNFKSLNARNWTFKASN